MRVSLEISIMAGKQKAIKPAPAMQGSIPFSDVPVPWPSARRISKQSINCSMKQCGKKEKVTVCIDNSMIYSDISHEYHE